jgi:hypothetical protein
MHIKLRTGTNAHRSVNDDRYGDNCGWGNDKHNDQYYDFKLGLQQIDPAEQVSAGKFCAVQKLVKR